MLNQERIILMTKMASYEENEGKKNNAIMNYFRGDYVWLQVMKSFVVWDYCVCRCIWNVYFL